MLKHAYIVCETDENGRLFDNGQIISITFDLGHAQEKKAGFIGHARVFGTHELRAPSINDIFEVDGERHE